MRHSGGIIKNRRMALAAAAWMGVIFLMSAFPADLSSEQSDVIVEIVMAVIRPFRKAADAERAAECLSFIIRKCAHMTEYAVLVILIWKSLLVPGRLTRLPVFPKREMLAALFAGVLYAAGDEIHQLFVEGRDGHIRDVLIDTAGMLIGIAAVRFFRSVRPR